MNANVVPLRPHRLEVAGVTYEIRDLFSVLGPPAAGSPLESPGAPGQSPPEASSGALPVGASVRHRLTPGLVGRIVEIAPPLAKIELASWPPDDWWRRWGKTPVPVRVEYLELVE